MDKNEGILLNGMVCIGIAEGWCYFANMTQDKLCKAREDGSELQEWAPPLPDYIELDDTSDFMIDDGWVYFLHEYESSVECAGFYQMRLDGSELKMFHVESLEDVTCSLDKVEGGWAYFTLDYDTGADDDEDTEIQYKVRTDGSDRQER